MKTHTLLISALLLAPLAIPAANSESSPAGAAFQQLKSLAGEWEANGVNGKSHLSYELIAGGTALVERFSSPQMPSMLTVYTLDGQRLLLTHYCMAGNQPRMVAQPYDAAARELKFEFLDAGNLADPAAGHMHNARFRFMDANHFTSEWDFYENGKRKLTETEQYTRVR